jgi:hypothetical protein
MNVIDDAVNILFNASQEVMTIAAQAGVDAAALLNALPAAGQLITGNKVPVIHKKYRGTCSVLFHINQTKSGKFWPLLRFHTFKHGGIETEFNGLTWLQQQSESTAQVALPSKKISPVVVRRQTLEQRKQCDLDDDIKRADRFNLQLAQYQSADLLTPSHHWIKGRLLGYATPLLLKRITMHVQGDEFLLPLSHHEHGHTGFHKIISHQVAGDKKFHFVKQKGLFKGSYITISASAGFPFLPIALCEGVATGLTLALVWPGEIRIALSSSNMGDVRKSINQDVIIFNDEDIWKENSANAGRKTAHKIKRPQDIVCSPAFSCASYEHKPTDFNDLLVIDGFAALNKQISKLLSVCMKNPKATVTRIFS